MLVLLLDLLKLLAQVSHAVVSLLLWSTQDACKGALRTFPNDGRALVLMCKNLFVRVHLLAALVLMATPKLNLMQQISGHAINSVKLRLFPAEWACIRVLLEPVELAVAAQRLLTVFALNGVFKYVVTNWTDQLR